MIRKGNPTDATSASLRAGNRSGKSEGHACHARQIAMDVRTSRSGRDRRVPPRGEPDKEAPPKQTRQAHSAEADPPLKADAHTPLALR
jgi:hypothetical protein